MENKEKASVYKFADKVCVCKFIDIDKKILIEDKITEEINSLKVLKNEGAHFNVLIGEVKRLLYVRIEIENEKLKPFTQIRRIKYIPAAVSVREGYDDYCYAEEHIFPDPLMDYRGELVYLAPGINHQFCVSICADVPEFDREKLIVSVRDGEGALVSEKSIDLEFVNLELPKLDLIYTNWIHFDCICDQHRVEPMSDEFCEIAKSYIELAVKAHQNMIFVPLFTPPLDTDIGGERTTFQLIRISKKQNRYEFNFSLLERFINLAREAGMEYFEFCHLFSQWGAKYAPKIVAEINGKEEKIFGWETESLSEEYAGFLEAFLPQLKDFTDRMGIRQNCFYHISDEPKREDLKTYRQCCALVKKSLGEDVKIIDALSDYDFYQSGIIKTPVVQLSFAKEFIDKGVEPLYVYSCWEPYKDYYCSRFLSSPMQRTRVLGALLYLNGAKLYLHWGFNFYNSFLSKEKINPYEEPSAGGVFPGGDCFIVYPDVPNKKANASLRLIAIKEAMNDFRLLKLLESYEGRTAVVKMLSEYGYENFNRYPRDSETHRKMIGEVIAKIKSRQEYESTGKIS